MGQPAHPVPQEERPFFLFRMRYPIISATITIKMAQITMVAKLLDNHVNMLNPPSIVFRLSHPDLFCQPSGLVVWLKQHEKNSCQDNQSGNQPDSVHAAGKDGTNLVDH